MPFRGVYNFLQANIGTAAFAFQFYNAAHADGCRLGWKLGDVDEAAATEQASVTTLHVSVV